MNSPYKFAITFENSVLDGYVSEKIMTAMLAVWNHLVICFTILETFLPSSFLLTHLKPVVDDDNDFFQGSIPIYYGTPRVLEFFNPKAFIYCGQHAKRSVNHNIANVYVGQSQVPAWHFDECIQQIKEIDR